MRRVKHNAKLHSSVNTKIFRGGFACVFLCVNCFDLSAETSEIYGLVKETFEHDNKRLRFLTHRLILDQLKIFSFSKRIVIYAGRY